MLIWRPKVGDTRNRGLLPDGAGDGLGTGGVDAAAEEEGAFELVEGDEGLEVVGDGLDFLKLVGEEGVLGDGPVEGGAVAGVELAFLDIDGGLLGYAGGAGGVDLLAGAENLDVLVAHGELGWLALVVEGALESARG